MTDRIPIAIQGGVTEAERYLSRLCAKSFLSLWSYPGIYRDQGITGRGDGKEICDLIVVFKNDIIIFSDKDCRFPDSGKLDVDWVRWFRRAVQKSADQVWGAERWIKKYPNRVFVDRRCTQQLPVPLPAPGHIRVHRVVVAHDGARRCKELLGGSGSLVIFPALKGNAHVAGPVVFPGSEGNVYEGWMKGFKEPINYAKTVLPFAIGDIDPDCGFVHVFDDTGLDIVLTELDTIADFVHYLMEREKFVRSDRLLMAAGEDELLAHYVAEIKGYRFQTFHIPENPEANVVIPEGGWSTLQSDTSWLSRKHADEVSYVWDRLIEKFSVGILDGTSPAYPIADFARQELAVRALASESRLHRRILARAYVDFHQKRQSGAILARVVAPIRPDSPYYIFVAVRPEPEELREDYRTRRRSIAYGYLIQGKNKYAAKEVIVIATETPEWTEWNSEDVLYRGDGALSEEEIESVREWVEDQGALMKLTKEFEGVVHEYPLEKSYRVCTDVSKRRSVRIGRNEPCPCGSGFKFKKCCLAR